MCYGLNHVRGDIQRWRTERYVPMFCDPSREPAGGSVAANLAVGSLGQPLANFINRYAYVGGVVDIGDGIWWARHHLSPSMQSPECSSKLRDATTELLGVILERIARECGTNACDYLQQQSRLRLRGSQPPSAPPIFCEENVRLDERCPRGSFPEHDFIPPDPNSLSGLGAITDLARLSTAAYRDSPNSVQRVGGGTFERIDPANDPATGFNASTYVDRANKEAVVVYRGTEGMRGFRAERDWAENFTDIARVGITRQRQQAVDYAERQIAEFRRRGYRVMVTGHSLGGGLAEAAHQRTGAPFVSFNQAPVFPRTVEEAVGGAPLRRTGENGLRVYHVDDPVHLAREALEPAAMERLWGIDRAQEHPIDYETDDPHSISEMAEALAERFEEERGSRADCASE